MYCTALVLSAAGHYYYCITIRERSYWEYLYCTYSTEYVVIVGFITGRISHK